MLDERQVITFEVGVTPTLDCRLAVTQEGERDWRVNLNGAIIGVGHTRYVALHHAAQVCADAGKELAKLAYRPTNGLAYRPVNGEE